MENSKALNTKVERYIELSIKFQKNSDTLFGKDDLLYNLVSVETIQYNNSSGHGFNFRTQSSPPIIKSRAEKIREKAETEAKLAEEYDEYLTLQIELGNYFKALNKIEQ